MKMEAQIRLIEIDQIIPNRFQPRLQFDQEALNDLANSIREHGIIQPLVLRRLGDKYEIIAGERRYKASQIAGLTAVPAIIAELDDNESAEVAIIENTHRKNLSAIEEAKSYQNLLSRGYITQEQLAKRMGKSQSSVANKIRLLNLDELVQEALINEKISERHARSLLKVTDKNKQIELLNKIVVERWPVKKLDEVINQLLYGNFSGVEDIKIDIPTFDNVNIINNNNNLYEDVQPASESKNSLFFNNLENEAVNMDPSANFGFNPFKDTNLKKKAINVDYDILDINDDEEDTDIKEESTPVKVIEDSYESMDDVIKGIKKIINKAQENGVLIENEEFNFDTLYQFIIKINK